MIDSLWTHLTYMRKPISPILYKHDALGEIRLGSYII